MLQLQRFPGESDASLVELRRVQGSVAHIIRAEFGKGAEEGGRARPTVRPHDEGIVFRVAFMWSSGLPGKRFAIVGRFDVRTALRSC